MTKNESIELIKKHLNGMDKILTNTWAWVYYPWSNRLMRILNKEEFIMLRTKPAFNSINWGREEEQLRKYGGLLLKKHYVSTCDYCNVNL